jgi:hypothetical protein
MAPLDFHAPSAEASAEGIDKLPREGERTLINGGQGTGKSRTLAEKVAELPSSDVVLWWLVPTLEKAEEQVAEYARVARAQSMPARVVRGRGAPDPLHEGEKMCPHHLVVNRAASMGVDVQEVICDGGCPLRRECGFKPRRKPSKTTRSACSSWPATICGCRAPPPDPIS